MIEAARPWILNVRQGTVRVAVGVVGLRAPPVHAFEQMAVRIIASVSQAVGAADIGPALPVESGSGTAVTRIGQSIFILS